MADSLATIVTIKDIIPIKDADKIVLTSMNENGWECVTRKGDFNPGDKAIYIMIDSIVDKNNPYFSFMEGRKYRVWNAKFKGTPSQGLLVPASMLTYYNIDPATIAVGTDVTTITNTIKYERSLDVTIEGGTKGTFPTELIRITDESNLLSCPRALEELENGNELYITQKQDGSSFSAIYYDGVFEGCSRRLKKWEGAGFVWDAIKKYNIKERLIEYCVENQCFLALQGEAIGPKLNGNRLELKEAELRIFNVKNLTTKEYYGWEKINEVCSALELPVVPLIEIIKFDRNIHTKQYFQELANKQLYPNGKPGEGIVIRKVIPTYSNAVHKEWSVKVINQNYL